VTGCKITPCILEKDEKPKAIMKTIITNNRIESSNTMNWHAVDWKRAYEYILSIQEQLVVAAEEGNWKLVYNQQRRLVTSFSACAVAVRRVVTNQGGKTPGIDGVIWSSPERKFKAILELQAITRQPKAYKASPVRRVMIPKPGTSEMRPLGIPTMIDRAVQAVYHMAVDPIVELQSDPNSYGFRKYRSTHDAITTLRTLLDKPHSAKWILETDVAKCFDKIDHKFLMENTPIADKCVLEQWLRSGVMYQGKFSDITEGTPQGGIISPMLCNVALNGMEKEIKSVFPAKYDGERGARPKIHVIRYADDIVITGHDKELLSRVKPVLIEFLQKRGLTIKEAKTRLVHIEEGFDFLGFNIRRYPTDPKRNGICKQSTVLIIRPMDKKVAILREKISSIIRVDRPLERIISDLNPILRGWSEYYRISYHSVSTFKQLHNYVWERMWNWCRKKHPRKTAEELRSMYQVPHPTLQWVFGKSPTPTPSMKYIYNIGTFPSEPIDKYILLYWPLSLQSISHFEP
jgi:RNA-directed DNA polymerase